MRNTAKFSCGAPISAASILGSPRVGDPNRWWTEDISDPVGRCGADGEAVGPTFRRDDLGDLSDRYFLRGGDVIFCSRVETRPAGAGILAQQRLEHAADAFGLGRAWWLDLSPWRSRLLSSKIAGFFR